MTTIRERDDIRAAIEHLLQGTPRRSDGALTVVSLVIDADVKRHVLTHGHTDLKDDFYARVRAQGHVSASERKLRDDLTTAQRRLAEAQTELTKLRAANESFARVVQVLEVENEQLRASASQLNNVRPKHGPGK